MSALVHASCIAAWSPAGWRGALIRGPSGAGKSDLVLRLAARPGWRLAADDYAHVWASGGELWARAPETLAGRIEVRGLGVIGLPHLPLVRVILLIDLTDSAVERHPESQTETLQGVCLRRLDLDPRPASAVELVAAAMATL